MVRELLVDVLDTGRGSRCLHDRSDVVWCQADQLGVLLCVDVKGRLLQTFQQLPEASKSTEDLELVLYRMATTGLDKS